MVTERLRVPRVLEPGQRQVRPALCSARADPPRWSLSAHTTMKPIKLIARGLVSGQVHLTSELLAALRQLSDQGDPAKATVITITEVAMPGGDKPATPARFGRLVSIRSLPPRRRCMARL